jgi:integrase
MLSNVLREWDLGCRQAPAVSVLPGVVASRSHRRGLLHRPRQIARPCPGAHAPRHFFASWSINRKADGGLKLPIKVVQGRLGHASIKMTADVYGHLFPRGDDAAEFAAAEKAFLAI